MPTQFLGSQTAQNSQLPMARFASESIDRVFAQRSVKGLRADVEVQRSEKHCVIRSDATHVEDVKDVRFFLQVCSDHRSRNFVFTSFERRSGMLEKLTRLRVLRQASGLRKA